VILLDYSFPALTRTFSYFRRMMLVITAVLPLLIAASILHVHLVVSHVSKEEETFARANQTASEAFSAIRTISAFNMQDQMAELYRKNLEKPTAESRKRAWWAGLGFAFAQFIMYGLYSVAFWYMGLEISRGYSSFEDALRAFFAVFMAAFGFAQAQLYFPDVAKGSAATQRVFSVIDRIPTIDASFEGGIRLDQCTGEIVIDKVTFSYPQRPSVKVFQGFSLSIPAGSTVALVGESGSGKSTVISIIERFYDPQKGTVLLDGVDIKNLNLHWLRAQIGLVSQEPIVFNLSIADNIRYGYPDASLEKVAEAAKAAFADSFVNELQDGLDTKLGEGAVQLSGGQKQRIAIARAIIKNPRVLLLDEATSALDAESEHAVQEALDHLMVGRTTLIVAHRLSTVFHSNSIAVIHSGRIVEQGSHEELVAKNGAYAHLVARQMLSHQQGTR
jgi:ATP-binding cassette subfamily B (MDR/TAP) protein 1